MNIARLRDQTRRRERLDEDWFHLFSLDSMLRALRDEPEYASNGHSGLTLLKTESLSVVLEAASAGSEIAEHTFRGPTVVHVLEGSLHIASQGETRVARPGEMVVVPHHRPRELRVEGDAAFLWTLPSAPGV